MIRRSRPVTVTIAFVVALLQAVTSLVSGSLLLGLSRMAEVREDLRIGEATLIAYGIVYLLLGAVTIGVAFGVRRGSGSARLYLTVMMIVSVVVAGYGAVALGLRGHLAAALIGIGFAVAVLVLLWNRRANDFYVTS